MKSYLKFLSRNKAYTFINVAGLVMSLMFIILLGDYTWRQYSIDRWHKNADRICLLGTQNYFFLWPQAAEEIKAMYPEVEDICCLISQKGKIKYGQQTVKSTEKENCIMMLADSTFFRFFDFPLVQGDRMTVLNAPDRCVITEQLAKRLFSGKNPIGETIQLVGDHDVRINDEDPHDSTLVYTISAVVKDFDRTVFPNETQVIANMARYPQVMGYSLDGKAYAVGPTGGMKAFFMLRPGTSLEGKKKVINDYLTENYHSTWDGDMVSITPMKDILFSPQNEGRGLIKGDKARLRILLVAVLAILFFAISNYINLTVANTGFRAKEMATRILFGSSKHQISLKLIAESTLMVAVSFLVGLALAFLFQDDAASLFKGKIALANDVSIGSVSICLGFILVMGIISGILPSWQMARYQPIDIVKGNFRYHSKMVLGRLFIIIQNIISVLMLTAALVIWLQLNHLIHAPLGYHTENLYYIDVPYGKGQAVRNQLEKMPFVETIGHYKGTSFSGNKTSAMGVRRDDKYIMLIITELDKTAWNLFDLKILNDYGNANNGYYLNEEALRQLDYTEKDREIDWGDGTKSPITGVLADFHVGNVLGTVRAFAVQLKEEMEDPDFVVKTNGDRHAKAAFIDMFKQLGCQDEEIKWLVRSMEEDIANTFEDHQNTLHIITLFAFIAVVISIMGYVGMSLFFIRQRLKEIGIRKIMGSTSHEAMWLMFKTFCTPLLLSFIIAIPLSWYIIHDWLTNFSYRITLSPWIFIITCVFALLVAVLSVCVQIVKAVRSNPVESIKTE